MKKTIVSLCMLAIATVCAAQETSGNNTFNKVFIEAEIEAGTKCHNITPLGYGMNVGYEITNRFMAFAKIESLTGLYEKDDVRTYNQANLLGGGLGFRLLKGDTEGPIWEKGMMRDLRAGVTTSVGNCTWKQTDYDACIKLALGSCKVKPTFSLGYRHINSYSNGMPDLDLFFATLGIRV